MATKFVVPDAQARSAAVGDISTLTPALKKVFDPDSQCFKPIRKPKRGEWLAEQKEVGQPFEKFKKHVHNVPHSSYRSVLVLPVGDFHEQASPSLELLAEFARAFFFGLPVQITKAVPLSATKSKTRVNDMTGNLQVLAGDLQRYAAEASKAHARTTFCTIVVTMEDLYPREEWNFVFGQANLLDSVGVFSFARYHPQFPARAKTPLSHSDMKIMLRRSCSVLAHECVVCFGDFLVLPLAYPSAAHVWYQALHFLRLSDERLKQSGGVTRT
eukprot:TRINITY_DN2965_c0_g4_i1.p1 TRINITY_DN2965_c0_g4~~TRINITY_DN2965_c0_g4_i1.p1  ORF type:complete len:271 (+),score=42.50 TRINITY_DN2965_c0_g4_i1:61-873(+)